VVVVVVPTALQMMLQVAQEVDLDSTAPNKPAASDRRAQG
jgi:hypothetical protein